MFHLVNICYFVRIRLSVIRIGLTKLTRWLNGIAIIRSFVKHSICKFSRTTITARWSAKIHLFLREI